MITIASLLDKKANSMTESIWNFLEQECELSEIKTIPHPHFSWLTAESIPFENVKEEFQSLSCEIPVFSVQTTGIGVFTGLSPILYLPVIKTKELTTFHELIWGRFTPWGNGINSYYSPKNWMPHVTIAFGDVVPDRLGCAIQNLAVANLEMGIEVDNLAMLVKDGDKASVGFVQKLISSTL